MTRVVVKLFQFRGNYLFYAHSDRVLATEQMSRTLPSETARTLRRMDPAFYPLLLADYSFCAMCNQPYFFLSKLKTLRPFGILARTTIVLRKTPSLLRFSFQERHRGSKSNQCWSLGFYKYVL